MSTPVSAMLLHIKPEDIPCKPITMNAPAFLVLFKKYESSTSFCQSRSGYIFGWLGWLSEKLNLTGISYIKDLYAVLDEKQCLIAIRDIDFLLQHFCKNPEFVVSVFKEGFSPDEILSILNLSDSELSELAEPDGDNFYACVSYLRDQRHFLDSVQKEGDVALHIKTA